MTSMESKSALLLGASGLVGEKLLDFLLDAPEYTKIVILVRKSPKIKHPKLEEYVINFDQVSDYKEYFRVQDVFCCLGTTIKKAGNQEEFKKVDLDYCLEAGRLSKEMQVQKFLIISSMGANPRSSVFYSRIKGILERELSDVGIPALHIFRPSLLLGERKEHRLGEAVSAFLARGLLFFFVGPLEKYKPIKAEKVALGMYKAARRDDSGVFTYLSNEIPLIY